MGNRSRAITGRTMNIENIDWAWLLNTIDYNRGQWFMKEDHEWAICKRKEVFQLLDELYGNPNKIMKLMWYRDKESVSR